MTAKPSFIYSLDDDRFYADRKASDLAGISTLLSACFHIGYRCNMSCPYCLSRLADEPAELIPSAELCRFLQEAGVRRLVMSGGEPFLYADTMESMLAEVKARTDCAVVVSTNASQEQTLQRCSRWIDWYDISLPAVTREAYFRLRGTDDFDTVIRHIRLLLEAGRRVRINCTLRSPTQADVWQYLSFVKDLGVHNARLHAELQPQDGSFHDEASYTEIQQVCRQFQRQEKMVLYPPLTPDENEAFKQGYLVIRRDGMCFRGVVHPSCQIGRIGENDLMDKLRDMVMPLASLFLVERRAL